MGAVLQFTGKKVNKQEAEMIKEIDKDLDVPDLFDPRAIRTEIAREYGCYACGGSSSSNQQCTGCGAGPGALGYIS